MSETKKADEMLLFSSLLFCIKCRISGCWRSTRKTSRHVAIRVEMCNAGLARKSERLSYYNLWT